MLIHTPFYSVLLQGCEEESHPPNAISLNSMLNSVYSFCKNSYSSMTVIAWIEREKRENISRFFAMLHQDLPLLPGRCKHFQISVTYCRLNKKSEFADK